jgi:hypothetical protein
MPIILPNGLQSDEIRVLQEFRRLNVETLPLEKIKAIKHPAGKGGEAPAVSLADRGWIEVDGPRENFTLTQKAKDFLAIDARPLIEETSDAAASAAGNPDADGV